MRFGRYTRQAIDDFDIVIDEKYACTFKTSMFKEPETSISNKKTFTLSDLLE